MVLFIHLYGNDFCKSVKTKYLRQKKKDINFIDVGGDINNYPSSTFQSTMFFSSLEKLTPTLTIFLSSILKRPA